MREYDPRDWYWIVNGDATQVFASKRTASVPVSDRTYQDFVADDGQATRIASVDELIAVLRTANVPPYHRVPCSLIVDRLQAAGKLTAARAALDQSDLYTRERWNNRELINADDPTALALLQAIGADPAVIMAPAT